MASPSPGDNEVPSSFKRILRAFTSHISAMIPRKLPRSAMNMIRAHLKLYGQTGNKSCLEAIAMIIDECKEYETLTEGMTNYQAKREAGRPKWRNDIEDMELYEFCYGGEELEMYDAELVLDTMIVDLRHLGKERDLYPHLTAANIKILKDALLLSGQFLDFKYHIDFITIGTYYLGTRDEHPIYKPITPLGKSNIKRSKLRTCRGEEFEGVSGEIYGLGEPTDMQLVIRESVLARQHEVMESEPWKKGSVLEQCYIAQSLGIRNNVKMLGELVTDQDLLKQLVADLLVEVKWEAKKVVTFGLVMHAVEEGDATDVDSESEEDEPYVESSEEEFPMRPGAKVLREIKHDRQ